MGLLAAIELRASIENPSTSLADPDAWLVDALGGGITEAGVSVNHSNALKFSAVWACVNVLAQDVAGLPLMVYRRLPRGKEVASEHPLYAVLHDKSNPEMTALNFRRTLQAHVVTWGNAYAEIERNGAGDVIGLWPLLPDRTTAHRVNGRKVIITRVGATDITLAAENVLHITGLGFDGLRGYSVIGMARQAIGAALAAEQFGAAFFGHGARPGGVITRPDQMPEENQQRFRRSWNRIHEGLSGAQRIAILDEGMDYKSIGIPPEEAQFIATRQHSVEDIVRFFRVPPHKVQHLLRSTYSNITDENRSYVTDTLHPWLVCWEQEINTTLFRPEEQRELFAEHNAEGRLRGSPTERSDFYMKGINNGWLSPNDVREMENMGAIDGGDTYFVPLNLMPLGSDMLLPADVEPEANSRMRAFRESRSLTERQRIQQTHVRGFGAIAERLVKGERESVTRLVEQNLRAAPDFLADLRKFYERFESRVAEAFRPLLLTYADQIRAAISAELGNDVDASQYDGFVQEYLNGLARRHVRKSELQLRAIVDANPPETLAAAITERLDGWGQTRAGKIAASESVRAMGALSRYAYAVGGVVALVWRTVSDSCPYCSRMNGRVVSMQQNFANAGDTIDPESDEHDVMTVKASVGHPPLHKGCDCLVGASSGARAVQRADEEGPAREKVVVAPPAPITLNVTLPPREETNRTVRFVRDEHGAIQAMEVDDDGDT